MANGSSKTEKIWNVAFISIFAVNLLLNLGQYVTNSIVAKYANFLGAPSTLVGAVASAFALTALIFKIVSAPAIDTFNRKYILAGAMAIMTAAFAGFGLSKSVPFLMSFRLLQGVGQAFTATCCLTLATDALPQNKLATGIGYFSVAQAACQAIGPTIGLKLADLLGYNATFFIGAAIVLVGIALALSLPVKHERGRKFRISPDNVIAKEAVLPAVILFFLALAFYVINSFLAIYGDERGVGTNIGYFFTVSAVILLFSRPLIGKLTDKFGYIKIFVPTIICFAASFILISFSDRIWMFLLAAVLNAFGYGACQPAIQSLCMKRVPKERRGAASCTSYIDTDLGSLVGPVIAGAIVSGFGYANMWRVMTVPIFMALAFILINRRAIMASGQTREGGNRES